jgi:threonyl-tRNA synthetase
MVVVGGSIPLVPTKNLLRILMPIISLPDGKQLQFEQAVTVADIALSIGAGLAKAALAGKVNGQLVDTSYQVSKDADFRLITSRDPEGVDLIRHSCAHLLAHAVKQLFPSAQVTIGPVIENGFYYDFAYERPFTPEDLTRIEQKMAELVAQDLPIMRKTMRREEAIHLFQDMGEHYKAEIIAAIPEHEILSLYQQGEFIDLCRGPHVPSTGKLGVFKLMKVAGAYWRGDSNNAMLQRIYGTAWTDKKDLQAYLHRLEEAEKRDHRKIGKAQGLFHMQEEAPGMVFWHPAGWTIVQSLKSYLRDITKSQGYQEINTPQIMSRSLWEASGHWDKFGEDMFTLKSEERDFAVKPMSCPGHVQVFNQGLRSYKELPLRFSEFGCCHRNEASGALHGLMRVRGFVQDDGHIFCTENQIASEVEHFIDSLFHVYKTFGFEDLSVKLSTRPAKRVGSEELWDKAEQVLQAILERKQLAWELNPGEGAFYGPKVEFKLRDSIGRVWQCGTVQLDFSLPQRLGANYIAEDSSKQTPVMIHRAIIGTLERFIGILTEHFAGRWPIWLAPWQAVVLNITDKQVDFSTELTQQLADNGYRVKSDLRNEKIGFKIREHTLQRVPYLCVVGEREAETKTVSVRHRNGEDMGNMTIAEFSELLRGKIHSYALD